MYWTILVVGFLVFCADTILAAVLTFHEETTFFRTVFVVIALVSLLGLIVPGGLGLPREFERES
jgi:hypothetical protein